MSPGHSHDPLFVGVWGMPGSKVRLWISVFHLTTQKKEYGFRAGRYRVR